MVLFETIRKEITKECITWGKAKYCDKNFLTFELRRSWPSAYRSLDVGDSFHYSYVNKKNKRWISNVDGGSDHLPPGWFFLKKEVKIPFEDISTVEIKGLISNLWKTIFREPVMLIQSIETRVTDIVNQKLLLGEYVTKSERDFILREEILNYKTTIKDVE